MASTKIVKKRIPHSISIQLIGDAKMRDIIMKISENEKVLESQVVNLQNAVMELQKD